MRYRKVMKYVIERQGYRNEEDKCEGLRNSKNFFKGGNGNELQEGN